MAFSNKFLLIQLQCFFQIDLIALWCDKNPCTYLIWMMNDKWLQGVKNTLQQKILAMLISYDKDQEVRDLHIHLDYSLLFIKQPSHLRICFSYTCGTLQVLITFSTTWIKTEISPPVKSFPFAVLFYVFIISEERVCFFSNAESPIYRRWGNLFLQKWTLINGDLSVLSHILIWFLFYFRFFFSIAQHAFRNVYLKMGKKALSEFLKLFGVWCPF